MEEKLLTSAIRELQRGQINEIDEAVLDADVIATNVTRAELSIRSIQITTTPAAKIRSNQCTIPWQPRQPDSAWIVEANGARQPDAKLVQDVVRAHAWLRALQSNRFETVEALAASAKLHPKLVRQELRYVFLVPTITEAILNGDHPATLSLARVPKTLPLAWSEQWQALGF